MDGDASVEPGEVKAAWDSVKLPCSSLLPESASRLEDSFISSASAEPSVQILAADFEAMKSLGIPVLEEPSSWDHSFACAPNGELVRERTGAPRAANLLSGTHGPKGLKSLTMSAVGLDAAKAFNFSFVEKTLSGENAVHGTHFTWIRGENIGAGAMGSVFKALDQKTGEIIAVKEVRIDEGQTADLKFLQALENEISILKDLRHPQIVSFLGFDYVDSRLYVYLDYMPGGSLAQVIHDFGALDETLTASYTQDIVEGLQYLHSREPSVVHRDIKGANILVALDCRVKLSDFGCSKRSEDLASVTMRGSIPWMAPEVIMQRPCGCAADIWSLGCVVIEMATAKPPWGGFDNHMAAMYKIGMSKERVPIPEGLCIPGQEFLDVCLERDPEKRATALELQEHTFLGSLTSSTLGSLN